MSVVQKATGVYELAILSRILRPGQGELSQEAARAILALDFDPADRERMHDLALKAQDGQLSTDEEQEADSYERISHLLGLLRSKARTSLHGRSAA